MNEIKLHAIVPRIRPSPRGNGKIKFEEKDNKYLNTRE